jgi:hypothetical protein
MFRRSAILAALAGAVLVGPFALAQDAPVTNAAPSPEAASPPPETPPPPAAPLPSPDQGAPITTAPPPAPAIAAPGPVEAQPLDTLDLFSAGRDTGLGADLWKGSSAAIARAVIPTLAGKPLSPAFIALARRVLATGANAPEGAGSDAALAAARARVLLALGDAPDVDAILDRTPSLAGDASLSQIAAEAALITDQPDKACRIGDSLSTGRDGLYWLRLRAYCQARQGKSAEAQLTLTLAAQQGADPDYQRLMGVILASAGDPGAASLRDGLDYALSHQLQLDPTAALATAPAAIAEHVRSEPPPAAPAPAAGAAAPDHILVAAPPVEADVLAALRAAKTPADDLIAAKAQDHAISMLASGGPPLTAPVQLASAALAAGDLMTAQSIRASVTQDTIPGADRTDLAILDAAIAIAAGKPDLQTLDRLAELGGSADAGIKARAEAATAIFAPLSGGADPAVRAALAGFDIGPMEGTAGANLALDLAGDAKARGDVALLSLGVAQGAGAMGPGSAERAVLERALARAGFEPDARAVALEGLLALQSR